MSGVAVPLLFFFGLLCLNSSPMIEIPEHMKPDAGKGCFMAAFLYAGTFLYAYSKMQNAAEKAK
eukprot:CAMPEP_0115078112 /NCGR_PEP_ID=MMETSP0227-20121206/17377_1 /TAXON_ID=89957 /ORGANISM="Polarella glacialis, Strain CCMP 1383" /LENGTH=63 /DNA_ID=CAMNT_0002465479 /DNA_START=115 /DNA_END=306 /DNA_ORIENTATION=+